jgi:hypothetical protein
MFMPRRASARASHGFSNLALKMEAVQTLTAALGCYVFFSEI